ncbi:MAG: 1-deoxy-D-xylulose-5-phosphate synthase [Fusobacteriaceae bacterium]
MIDIKKMNSKELEKKASDIRELLISTVSKTGGHLAPNLGVVELTIAIHRIFDSPKDKIIFDVGHQSYVHKILTGREDKFSTLRQRFGIGPFSDPKESDHDVFISGHAGTAISAGLGIAKANPNSKIVIVVGDASMCNGHSMEALNNIGEDGKNIIVILNDNEMSIGKNVGALSNFLSKLMSSTPYRGLTKDIRGVINKGKIGGKITSTLERVENSVKQFFSPLSISELLGFKFFGSVDGHNIQELEDYLTKAKDEEGPCFVHVKTQKGKGYIFAEEDSEKFHGVSPFDLETGKTGKNKESYSSIFGKKICELGEKDKDIIAISGAMIKGVGLGKFEKKYPDRIKDVGIAEGHGVTYSAGLAISGKKPYLTLYSTFMQRGFSQLIHDISLQELPVKVMIDRAGIVGEDGKTHNGIYDIGMFLTVPNFIVFAPTTGEELAEIMEKTKEITKCAVMVRYPREVAYEYEFSDKFEIGKWREVKKGMKNLLIATGSMFQEVMSIENELLEQGIDATIVSAASIKPLDEKYIVEEFKKYDNIIILEEGYTINSFGSSIIEFLNENKIYKKINKISIEDPSIPHGKRDVLLKEIGLRGERLIERIKGSIDAQ